MGDRAEAEEAVAVVCLRLLLFPAGGSEGHPSSAKTEVLRGLTGLSCKGLGPEQTTPQGDELALPLTEHRSWLETLPPLRRPHIWVDGQARQASHLPCSLLFD